MPYSIGAGKPFFALDMAEFEHQVALFSDAQVPPVAVQADYDTLVNGLTNAQLAAAMKALLKCIRVTTKAP